MLKKAVVVVLKTIGKRFNSAAIMADGVEERGLPTGYGLWQYARKGIPPAGGEWTQHWEWSVVPLHCRSGLPAFPNGDVRGFEVGSSPLPDYTYGDGHFHFSIGCGTHGIQLDISDVELDGSVNVQPVKGWKEIFVRVTTDGEPSENCWAGVPDPEDRATLVVAELREALGKVDWASR